MDNKVDNKPDFVTMEKKILQWWYESGLMEKYLHKNDSSKKKFFFLDGPITANNPMGVHHAWGRTYKDLWQRYFNMKGYKQRFQNGFDCQGLWVEVEVEKELGLKNKKDIENLVPGDKNASIDKFVNLCKERVQKFSTLQTQQSKRLGYFMDWEHSYYTNSPENNYMIWYFLKKCHEKGLLYKGHDSVPWCYRCGIAISQHEILTEDYQELTHDTIYFKLPLVNQKNTSLLLWTTTPWTVPGNVAVAVNTNEKYVKVKFKSEFLILMEKRYREIKNDLGLGEVVEEYQAKDLIGWEYTGPFDNTALAKDAKKKNPRGFHFVISGALRGKELVTAEEGTGLLHVAPGAGEEDFWLGKELDLGVINLIDEDARYVFGMDDLTGKNAKIHPELIFDKLNLIDNARFFLATRPITHRYPVCWRCKTELVWRVVDEWYIKMSEELRENMRKVVKTIKWIPDFGLERELDWINNMHDWLISKKRYYGLCLPIYECAKCHTFEVIGSKEELQNKAVEGWSKFFGHDPHRPWVDEVKIKCPKCESVLSRIPDVGNVWLDAGIVTYSTLVDPKTNKVSYMDDKKYFSEWFPADFITESFPGQFKNWFYSLLVMSTVLENKTPFNSVLGFASLLGEDGKPMHKSNKKTFVSFDDGADKIGADVLRWLFVTHDPGQNLLFGFKTCDDVRRKFHLLLWNIYVFFQTYYQLNDKVDLNNKTRINILDQWIEIRLSETIDTVNKSMEKYDAFTASIEIEKLVNDLSLWYVRRSRDRVNPLNRDICDRQSCFSTFYDVLFTIVKLLAPFTPYFSEEMYQQLVKLPNGNKAEGYNIENSVHLTEYPQYEISNIKASTSFPRSGTSVDKSADKQNSKKNEAVENTIINKMKLVREIAEKGHAARKLAQIKVRQPLATLTVINALYDLETEYLDLLKAELNVKKILLKIGKEEMSVELDINLTDSLITEGQARDLVRKIQDERKKLGCGLNEKVTIYLPEWPEDCTEYLKAETLAKDILKGDFKLYRDKMES